MQNISPADLKELLQKDTVLLIDVREAFEHSAKRIAGSVNMPSTSFSEVGLQNPQNKTIVFHCKGGTRSASVISKMQNKACYNLEGGIEAWIAQGFDVETSGKKTMALDRQVQLSIGSILLICFALIYFVSVKFAFAVLFVGLGLCFAGITGFCGLAIILAKAPWNKRFNGKKITSCHIDQASK